MKTLRFLFIVLLVSVFAISNLNAQTDSGKEEIQPTMGVWCDGVLTLVFGDMTIHWRAHFSDNSADPDWLQYTVIGQGVSSLTGEVFNFQMQYKGKFLKNEKNMVSMHFVGNQGTNIIFCNTARWVPGQQTIVFDQKLKCN